MKKKFKEFEALGTDKEDLKSKYHRGYKLEGRFDKLIDGAFKTFYKDFHELMYLDDICFNLYGVEEDAYKFIK